ncbi:MAG: hypothetical protein ACRENE_07815 [Polyangiaceae bacterium]
MGVKPVALTILAMLAALPFVASCGGSNGGSGDSEGPDATSPSSSGGLGSEDGAGGGPGSSNGGASSGGSNSDSSGGSVGDASMITGADGGASAEASVDAASLDVASLPEEGGSDGAPAGLIHCGSAWCAVASQDCCITGSWTEQCGSKGTCTTAGGRLSCSSPASCGAGQTCCATQMMSGAVTATCSSSPCTAGSYQLCGSPSDCPSGQGCAYDLIPAASGGPMACDQCAGVSCASGSQCCPSTGHCYSAGCGSCCN